MIAAEVRERRRSRDQQRDAGHRAKHHEGGQRLAPTHGARAQEDDETKDEEAEDRCVTGKGGIAPTRAGVEADEAGEILREVADIRDRDRDAVVERHGCLAAVRHVGGLAAAEHEPHPNRAEERGYPDFGKVALAGSQDEDTQGSDEHVEGGVASRLVAQEGGKSGDRQESPAPPSLRV